MSDVSGNERLVLDALVLRDEMSNGHPHFTAAVVGRAAATSALDAAVLRGEFDLSDWPIIDDIADLADKLTK